MERTIVLIKLTRLNSSIFYLNPELIETVEANPDTVIKLTNGKKYIVKEAPEEICRMVIEYRIKIATAAPADYSDPD